MSPPSRLVASCSWRRKHLPLGFRTNKLVQKDSCILIHSIFWIEHELLHTSRHGIGGCW